MHPLIGNLRELTDNQLNDKINQLLKMIRGSVSTQFFNQARMILTAYEEERNRRAEEALEQAEAKMNAKITDKIDIN